jgi:hypothetical protein
LDAGIQTTRVLAIKKDAAFNKKIATASVDLFDTCTGKIMLNLP